MSNGDAGVYMSPESVRAFNFVAMLLTVIQVSMGGLLCIALNFWPRPEPAWFPVLTCWIGAVFSVNVGFAWAIANKHKGETMREKRRLVSRIRELGFAVQVSESTCEIIDIPNRAPGSPAWPRS